MLGPVTFIVPLSYHNKPLCREVKGLLGKQIAQGHVAWKLWSLNLDLDLLTLKSIFFPMYSSAPIVLCHAAPTFPVPWPIIPLYDKPSRATYLRHALCFHVSVLMIFGPSSLKYLALSSLASELLFILQNPTLIAPPLLSFPKLTYPNKVIVALPMSSKCELYSWETEEYIG